jgi:hypothetical protein
VVVLRNRFALSSAPGSRRSWFFLADTQKVQYIAIEIPGKEI